MAEKLSTLPHDFDFTNDDRGEVTLVGAIRLNALTNVVTLLADSNGNYPVGGADAYVISGLYAPKAVRQWVGFQSFIVQVFDGPDTQLTSDGYRLHDGTNQFWFNGSAWVINTTSWNTEADVANNIATFAATSRQLRVVVKLATTDQTATPILTLVRVAWVGKVEAFEDILYRSLVPFLQRIRSIHDFAIKVPMPGGTSLDILTPVKASQVPFNVIDVDAVFNNNIDPDHYTNLLSSYNATTGIATLSTAVPVGQYAFVRLVCEPQVAIITTSEDYIEVEQVPAIQITGIEAVDSSPLTVVTSITNKSTGAIIVIPPPYRFRLRFTMIALAPGGVDLTRMLRAVVELVDNNPLITAVATGEQYRFWMIDEFNNTTAPKSNNLTSSQAMFEILDVLSFERPATTGVAVTSLNLNTSPL